jgi:glyoxylase-like metal-dependent hydrolase (beta-lactamase superfamily II)
MLLASEPSPRTGHTLITVIDFTAGPIEPDLDVQWIHGQPRRSKTLDPPLQVHWVVPHTVMFRQSKQLTYEAPFLYLLFGNHSAMLLDTGHLADRSVMPLRGTVDRLVAEWLDDHGVDPSARPEYRLVVAHTHGHHDHINGDDQFTDRPQTTVVGSDVASVVDFFGFDAWPGQTVTYDLGSRELEVTGTPGHHDASVTIYDPWTGFLLTGDTVYPGRLYVNDIDAFCESLNLMADLATSRRVTAVMGCHVEMTTTPKRDYPLGTTYQPDEPPLQMSTDQLRAVCAAASRVRHTPGVHVFDEFAIFNGRCVGGVLRQLARANGNRLRDLVMRR